MKTQKTHTMFSAIAALAFLILIPMTAPASATEDTTVAGAWSESFWEGGSAPFDPPSLENSRKFPPAVTSTVLPDGRVLYWNGIEGSEQAELLGFVDSEFNWVLENSRARVLDLRSGEPRWSIPTYERGTTDEAQDSPGQTLHDLFCTDQKFLWNGKLLIAGGMEARQMAEAPVADDIYGDDETRIFEPETDTFRSIEPMRERRWYPSMVTLPDGRVFVTSGVRQVAKTASNPEPSFSQVRLNEVFDPSMEKWREAGVNPFSLPLYPRLHLLPNGKIFYGGAGQTWTPFGYAADQTTWGLQRLYDPSTGTWSVPGPTLYGVRNGATSALLRLEAPYDEAKILIAGGTAGVAPSTAAATTLSEIVRWTPEGGIQNETVPKAPVAGLAGDPTQLRNRRWYGSLVTLPTGEVLFLNGGDMDDVLEPGSAAAVRTAELYDPKTGTWRELPAGPRDRVYHNSAVLLPDGSVLVGGNSPVPAHYYIHDNTLARSNNFKDSTFEIYKPPYMFRGSRPVVSSVTPVHYGRAIRVAVSANDGRPGAADISELVLVRVPAATHTVDADMRAVRLQHRVLGGKLLAKLPKGGDGRILPPGPYYLFAITKTPDGPVPSVAKTVLIQPAGEGKVIARSA